jgi:hypothetical protein
MEEASFLALSKNLQILFSRARLAAALGAPKWKSDKKYIFFELESIQ